MSKLKRILPTLFSLGTLMITIFTASYFNKNQNNKTTPTSTEQVRESENEVEYHKTEELRAVWIPFMDLQIPGEFSEENFKQNYKNILDRVESVKLNTVFVQVRPFSDALYPSKIFPWSHILTGEQGKNPGFDPLEFMISETHARNLNFHAWIVPMRIKNSVFPRDFSESNPCMKWKMNDPEKYNKYVVEDKEYMYYNPEFNEVRQMIVDGVKEIVENYDVDGINFDDYFYPAGNFWVDKKNYTNLTENPENNLIKKRMENINLLIREVYSSIKSTKSTVIFGICPQGNFNNSRNGGADIDTWASSEGYVDYLCPEIYTNSVNPILPFEKAASDWRKLVKSEKIKLYAGLGLYKTGTDEYDNGTWLDSDDIIMKQIEYIRKEKFDGFALYSSVYLDKNENNREISNIKKIIT